MKPRPTTIQPGATHWNPNAGPDWYTNKCCSDGGWMYFDAEEGNWDQGTWRWSEGVSGWVVASDLIPVNELMAQPPEWNGEGLPPVGAVCRLRNGEWVHAQAKITYMGNGVFCYEVNGTEYTGAARDTNFYPIKSEREKAIEAMSLAIRGLTYLTKDVNAIAAALFDAGYRKVEK